MTSRLPFTLTPLGGEPFEVWLHAYAARLAISPGQLAAALGIPGRGDHDKAATAEPSPAQLTAICAATGLAPAAVTAMLACGPSPPARLLRAWMPQRTTRFCPACLTEDPRQMPAAWPVPVTFFCPRHGQLLASCCPHCGRQPASPARPSRAGRRGGQDGCGGPLAAAIPPGGTGLLAARRAQDAISGLLTGIRDPGRTPAGRRQALGQLTGITLIAYHLAAAGDPRHRARQEFTPGMLGAGTLTTAFTLLTAHPGTGGHDRLASLVTGITPGTVPAAIPRSRRPASPALWSTPDRPRPRPVALPVRPAQICDHAGHRAPAGPAPSRRA